MDVVCERCQTEYEFDDALVSERGTTVKCTNCGHQFKIYRPVGDARAESRPFILRQADGTSVTFESLGVLQKWIVEGRTNRLDQLSRDGVTWKTLGSISELDTFFATAESARSLGRAPAAPAAPAPPAGATQNARAPARAPGPPAAQPAAPREPSSPRLPAAPAAPAVRSETTTQGMPARSVTMSGPGPAAAAPVAPVARPPEARGAVGDDTIESRRPGSFSMGSEDIRNAPDKFDFGETTGILERWGEGRGAPAPSGVAPTLRGGPAVGPPPARPPTDAGSSGARRFGEALSPDESLGPVVRPVRNPVTGALMGVGIGLCVAAVAGLVGWKLGLFGSGQDATPATAAPALDRVDLAVARAEQQARPATRAGFEEARDQLTALLGNEPDEPRVHAARGAVLALWGESVRQRAEDLEARAGASGADAATLRAQAAVLRQEAGASLERARQDAAKADEGAARVPAGQARARFERALGEATRVLGDEGAARRHLEAARAAGGGPEVDLLAALLERDADQADAAAAHLRALHGQMATQARARLALARLLAARGDAAGARAEIEGLLRSEPSHEDAQALLAAVTSGVAPFRPAPVAAAVAPVAPSAGVAADAGAGAGAPSPHGGESAGGSAARDYDALIAEAQRAQENGQRDRARAAFNAALAQRPGSSDALLGLGFLEMDSGNLSGAIGRFRQVLAANPRFSDAYWGLADAYRRQGNLEGALRAYRDYVRINPGGSRGRSAQEHIEELERRLHPEGESAGGSGASAGSSGSGGSGSGGSAGGGSGSGSAGGESQPAGGGSGSTGGGSGGGSGSGGGGSGSGGGEESHGGGSGAGGGGSSGSGSSGSGSGGSGSSGSGSGSGGEGSHGSSGGGSGSAESPGGT